MSKKSHLRESNAYDYVLQFDFVSYSEFQRDVRRQRNAASCGHERRAEDVGAEADAKGAEEGLPA